jgi:hypothetical protein
MTAVQHARERSLSASVLIIGLLVAGCAGGRGGASREPIAPEGAAPMRPSKPPADAIGLAVIRAAAAAQDGRTPQDFPARW